jgi:hypothetical protein
MYLSRETRNHALIPREPKEKLGGREIHKNTFTFFTLEIICSSSFDTA